MFSYIKKSSKGDEKNNPNKFFMIKGEISMKADGGCGCGG